MMKYALCVDSETNAVRYATYEKYAWDGCVIVDHLPDGDISDYDFIDGEYVLNEERKKAREEQEDVKSTEEIYAEALNILGVQTEVTENAE